MAKPKLTPWFLEGSKPKRHGVYQTSLGYQHWNGAYWGFFCSNPQIAAINAHNRSCSQRPRWRGLASNPKEMS